MVDGFLFVKRFILRSVDPEEVLKEGSDSNSAQYNLLQGEVCGPGGQSSCRKSGPFARGQEGSQKAEGVRPEDLETLKTGLLDFISANPITGNQTGPALRQPGPRN